MDQAPELTEPVVDIGASPVEVPGLLVELPPWSEIFFRNLRDFIRPRKQPPLRLSSKPADFWPDVFVTSRTPWGRFSQSIFVHAVCTALLWAGWAYWPKRPQIAEHPAFSHNDVIYYSAAEYLPPLDTGAPRAPRPQKGDPALAPQPIISVPPEADNRTQTIVTPPDIKLDHDVPLPNVVAWSKAAPSVPIAATQRSLAGKAPNLDVAAVAPPPEVKNAASRRALGGLDSSVVAPSPVVSATSVRRLGDLNMGSSNVVAPAPLLAVAPQRTRAGGQHGLGSGTGVVPPPPSVQGSGTSNAGGRLIALGLHPVAPNGPVTPPAGNRRGSFSATPQGKAGAAGTPQIAGNGNQSGSGAGGRSDMPSGLHVGSGANATQSVAGSGNGPGAPVQMAKVTPPRVSANSRQMSEVQPGNATGAEKEVFGDRKFYAMTLNVPNLNSSGGSWVIHFAELHGAGDQGGLTAPSPMAEADPAYPLELMKENIQGKVTLYAVIRSDGSVSDVRVLRSVDDRLDEYASAALAHWRFHPATKNGSAVDLEAVVTIPFRSSRVRSSF